MKKPTGRIITSFATTVAIVVAVGLIAPIAYGMMLSGSAPQGRSFDVFGLPVFQVTIDGGGGFQSTVGSGIFLIAVLLAVVVAVATVYSHRQGARDNATGVTTK